MICFCFLVCSLDVARAQVCSDPAGVIYSLTDQGNIRPIHVATGAVDSPLNVTVPLQYPFSNAMGIDVVNGNFYYFSLESPLPAQFVSFNPSSGVTTNLAAMPGYISVVSACVNATGTNYYCLNGGTGLYTYDITSDTWTELASDFVDQSGTDVTSLFANMSGGDMAMDANGDLWMVLGSYGMYALYEIPAPLPTTNVGTITVAQILSPTATPVPGAAVDGIAFDPVGNIYFSTETDLYLLGMNAAVTHMGSFNMASTEAMYDLTSCNFPFATALPVTWGNFTAVLQANKTVLLDWQFDQPLQGGAFSVERSPDGQHWTSIGSENYDATNLSGNYHFSDLSPLTGNDYYRIRPETEVQFVPYSPVKVIELAEAGEILISPNPVSSSLHVQCDPTAGSAELRVYSPAGEVLVRKVIAGGANVIDMSRLPSGVYIVEIQFASGRTSIQKVLKD